MALGGTMVAYAFTVVRNGVGEHEIKNDVVVRDLRDGRTLHSVPDGMPSSTSPGRVSVGPVESLVVKADGAVAWVALAPSEEGGNQLHVLDAQGSRLVAERADLNARSLRLVGSMLLWRQGGTQHSTVLD
ncbi:MAG: hypothetical protein ACYDA6_01860 [Solirubrobacteraceae bacterium]